MSAIYFHSRDNIQFDEFSFRLDCLYVSAADVEASR